MAHIEGIPNFRDVGKTVNEYLGKRLVREGLFYRSARPEDATPQDVQTLKETIGIKSVIDLRTDSEVEDLAKKRDALLSATGESRPMYIDGIERHHIKVTGRKFERHLVSLLSWPSFFKLIYLWILGYRFQAICLMAREAMLPQGLLGLNKFTFDSSKKEIKEALTLYATAQELPSLVHCSHGKDRTGLMCVLVLTILDIPREAIEYDYSLSDEALASEYDERVRQFQSIGLPADWAKTSPAFVSSVGQHLESKYGGVNQYLDSIGFGPDLRSKVRENLLY